MMRILHAILACCCALCRKLAAVEKAFPWPLTSRLRLDTGVLSGALGKKTADAIHEHALSYMCRYTYVYSYVHAYIFLFRYMHGICPAKWIV